MFHPHTFTLFNHCNILSYLIPTLISVMYNLYSNYCFKIYFLEMQKSNHSSQSQMSDTDLRDAVRRVVSSSQNTDGLLSEVGTDVLSKHAHMHYV